MNRQTTAPHSHPPLPGEALIATGIVIFIATLLSLLCLDIVNSFFPYAEEWKILPSSLPQFAEPLSWFRGFSQTMSDPYPAWAVNSIDFLRPVMNATYWLRGEIFGDDWGSYLYINFLTLGLAAGALYLTLRMLRDHATGLDDGTGFGLACLLTLAFLVMPAMISQASRFLPLILPQMAFDRLLAALCLLACLSYGYRQYLLATLLVAAALLTKEQAIPVAIALPLVFAWQQRRSPIRSLPTLTLLALPLLAWLGARLLLFGGITGSVYVLMDNTGDPAQMLQGLMGNLLKLPLYAGSLFEALAEPLSLNGIMVACNLVLLGYLALDTLIRWFTRGPEIISVAFIGCWGFLALVGLNPRYGTLLIALAIVMLARPTARALAWPRMIALAAFLLAAGMHATSSWYAWPVHSEFSKIVYDTGRNYASALSEAKSGTVVVLNDPNTMYTAPADLAKVLNLEVADVHKASDYPWPWPEPDAREMPAHDCQVKAMSPAPDRVEFEQSCGLQIMGALVPNEDPLELTLADGIVAQFPEAAPDPQSGRMQLGTRMQLQITAPDVSVLYFDPQSRDFHWVELAAEPAAAPAQPESTAPAEDDQ